MFPCKCLQPSIDDSQSHLTQNTSAVKKDHALKVFSVLVETLTLPTTNALLKDMPLRQGRAGKR